MKRRYILSIIFFLVVAMQLKAQVKVPAIFSDHMVLQCNKEVAIWGYAQPGARVTIKASWSSAVKSATASNEGYWKVLLKTPEPGGPYALTISDGQPVEIHDVLIGEVWLCSGQSNMARPMKPVGRDTVMGATEEFRMADRYNTIRYFEVGQGTRLELQADVTGQWKVVSTASLPDLSATSWFFGKALQEMLKSPVGLITSSWGGSKIEAWMSAEAVSAFPKIVVPEVVDSTQARKTPTILYNNMIHPLAGYAIRGAIWYQGEANIGNPAQYEKLLPAMVADWRRVWDIGDFPFYYLQIAPYHQANGLNSAYFREAQLKIAKLIPHSGIGFLTDAGEEKNIHPSNKKAAGERLACLALVNTYGVKGKAATGPVYTSMRVKAEKVYVSFDHAYNGLTSYGKTLTNFEIAGADSVFYPATAKIVNNTVVVSNTEKVQHPVAVRYAFKDFVAGDLFNKQGLPASSFRTDDYQRN
jgi:sialate O-acetylesterase